jgi:HAD superfamily hydrolase (TIGR01662 family)
MGTSIDVVVPTVGRPSLGPLVDTLLAQGVARTGRIIVVDDRRHPTVGLELGPGPGSAPAGAVEVLTGRARGPAAARNDGWRAADADWVVFLDDDVHPGATWYEGLLADLDGLDPRADVSQGRLRVPLDPERAPTDRERNVARLGAAPWITADLAVGREVLALSGGFDERFPRAYREDTDLALRLRRAGIRRYAGGRVSDHPVAPAPWWVSIRDQRGNADDARLAHLHGRRWREEAGEPRGRFRLHVLTVALSAGAALAAARGRRRSAAALTAAWLGVTAQFAAARLRGGSHHPREVAAMAVTSALVPPAAVAWRAAGTLRCRLRRPDRPTAVLFDRDGTLVHDVPYNGDADAVRLVPGARAAVERARAAGLAVGLITNQSGIGRGLITARQATAVNQRVEALVGPLDVVVLCPHDDGARCRCRKPAPGMVLDAARMLDTTPARCWVVGDIGADVAAAHAAGARAVLVPTPRTLPHEVATAPLVAPDLGRALDLVVGRR